MSAGPYRHHHSLAPSSPELRRRFRWPQSRSHGQSRGRVRTLPDAARVWGDRRSSIRRHRSTTYGDNKMLHSGRSSPDRRAFIGGSEARIIMGEDQTALLRLWREKRGELEPEDLSANLIVQLGSVTEHLNRQWYERSTGQVVTEVQRRV